MNKTTIQSSVRRSPHGATEISAGYKRTELGVIPKDWEMRTLEEIVDTKRPICYGIVQVGPFVRNGIPVLAIKNLNTDYRTNVHYCSPDIEALYSRSRVKSGDVLISVKGTTGRVGIVPYYFEGNISRDLARLRVSDENVPEFWFQMLQSETVQRKLEIATVGTTRLELSIGILKQVRMPYPPLDEQRAIASVLSDVDGKIGTLNKLIAKKQAIKHATMQQLLTGRTRLPEFNGEWKTKQLKDVAKNQRFAIVDGPFGSQMRVSEYVPSGVPVIEMEHLKDGWITKDIERYITAQKFEELRRSAVYPDDLIISKTGSLGYLGIVPEKIGRGIITSRLAKISLDPSSADLSFVFQWLMKLRLDGYWEQVSQGGTMQILGIDMLKNAPIPDISVAEQRAIAAVLTDMDAEIRALEQRRQKTKQVKHGMMQELLTGHIRLVSPKHEAKE